VNEANTNSGRVMPLIGVPNFSEGRDPRVIGALEATLGCHTRVLNRHWDAETPPQRLHDCGRGGPAGDALVAGAGHALDLIDLRVHAGQHPRIGALDVSPVVWQTEDRHDDAVTAARRVADGIAALGIPSSSMGSWPPARSERERAYFRQGGPAEAGAEDWDRASFNPTLAHPSRI